MANEGLADDLNSLLGIAEDIRDGIRSAFTPSEMDRLCFDLRRAVDYLRNPGEDEFVSEGGGLPGGPFR